MMPFECSDTTQIFPRVLHVKKELAPVYSFTMFQFLQEVNNFVRKFEQETLVPNFDIIMSVDGEPTLLAYFGRREGEGLGEGLEVI